MARFNDLHSLAIPACAILVSAALIHTALAQDKEAPLATYGSVKVTAADYDASILRIPEKDRFGWAMSQERINKELDSLLRMRTIAAEAKRLGLDADPSLKSRMNLYAERLLADAYAARVDAESEKEFDAKLPAYRERAREQYLVSKTQYQTPAQIKAAHILIRNTGKTPDEALARIKALRERIVAGESFETVAESSSDDPTAKQNKGELGYFGPGQMDAAFETAAFALSKKGDISEPVRTQFGFHLIRLDDRKPGRQLTFEEVAPDLLEKLKAQFIDARRAQVVGKVYEPSRIEWNEPAVVGLKKTVAPALLKPVPQ